MKIILVLHFQFIIEYDPDMLSNSQGRFFSHGQMIKKHTTISNSELNYDDISGQMNIFQDIFQSSKSLYSSRDFNCCFCVLEFQESW